MVIVRLVDLWGGDVAGVVADHDFGSGVTGQVFAPIHEVGDADVAALVDAAVLLAQGKAIEFAGVEGLAMAHLSVAPAADAALMAMAGVEGLVVVIDDVAD